MVGHGFLPQVTYPTRAAKSSSTMIDNIYSNSVHHNHHSGNILLNISEHFSQFLSVKRNKIDLKTLNVYRHDYSKFDAESFRDVSLQKWENNFYWRLEGCVQRHAPIKKLSEKELQATSRPWITREVENLIKHRDKLFKRKKRQANNEDIRSLHNQFRNGVKKSKKSYKTYFEDSKSDIKKTWEGIKSLINNSNSSLKITVINQ